MIELLLLKIPILGSKIIDIDSFLEMLIKFAINLIVAFIIIRKIYYPIHKRKDYLFTYFLFNILIFFVCILLNGVKLKLGFAFGLFAIFGILRYRTEQLPIKEMTYLFMIIAIAIVNSLSDDKVSLAELVLVNGTIVLATYLLEKVFLLKHESRKEIVYEKIENIKPENYGLLINDLKERTGLNIHRVQVGHIDFLKDTVRIIIFYYEDKNAQEPIQDIFISNKNE
ncbi:DUF4956 domain-containing protein [Brumimicrobium aurantiacum]|uniref:DUF4956 domain-containing protein n=1 Tax=Brumimicrobium aurantiacum TaxID=1737063 RepID=A0A3E1EV86_9FLAO|nr:DUF4956 domain-containing protein [Brumimicrobium aurantiacum]RFC53393.1 DUF4956 domain-containing protein [Brumimicrobium aurantiacum]